MRTTLPFVLLACLLGGGAACDSSIARTAHAAVPLRPVAITVHPSAAQPAPDGPAFDGVLWNIGTARGLLSYPMPLLPGDQIASWSLSLQRDGTTPYGPLTGAFLARLAPGATAPEQIGMGASDNRKITGLITLAIKLDSVQVVQADGSAYALMVGGDGWAGDRAGLATVNVLR